MVGSMADSTPVKNYAVPLPPGAPAKLIKIRLSVPEIVGFRGYVRFGEHVQATPYTATTRVVAVSLGGFHKSDDLGASWHRVDVPGFADARFVNSFTLPDGLICLQTANTFGYGDVGERRDSGMVVVCRPEGEAVSVFRPTDVNSGARWHGTSSIDCSNGTLMYAEYPNNAGGRNPDLDARNPSRVLRSRDSGHSWELVFEATGRQVRHFHVLRSDPHQPQTWWLASGDDADECRIWRSSDDGDSWQDMTIKFPDRIQIGDTAFTRHVFRLTDLVFPDERRMIWGTDDVLGAVGAVNPDLPRSLRGGARVIEAERDAGLVLKEIGYCGQAVRSIVDCGPCWLFITQGLLLRYTCRATVFAMFKGDYSTCIRLFDVDNYAAAGTAFTASRASRTARDGVFFTHRGAKDVFDHPVNVLKWEVSFE